VSKDSAMQINALRSNNCDEDQGSVGGYVTVRDAVRLDFFPVRRGAGL